jgi:hypothetical protein
VLHLRRYRLQQAAEMEDVSAAAGALPYVPSALRMCASTSS